MKIPRFSFPRTCCCNAFCSAYVKRRNAATESTSLPQQSQTQPPNKSLTPKTEPIEVTAIPQKSNNNDGENRSIKKARRRGVKQTIEKRQSCSSLNNSHTHGAKKEVTCDRRHSSANTETRDEPDERLPWHTVYEKVLPTKAGSKKDRLDIIRELLLQLDEPVRGELEEKQDNISRGHAIAKNYVMRCNMCSKDTCTFEGVAKWHLVGAARDLLKIWIRGKHGVDKPLDGGQLWNAKEWNILQAYVEGKTHISFKEIKNAFKAANLPVRCEPTQLHNFVKRYNTGHKKHPANDDIPIEQFEQHVNAILETQVKIEDGPVESLIVLSDIRKPVVEADQIYVPFASVGMLKRIRKARGKWVKLVMDVKQNVAAKGWGVLTTGFVACRQSPTWTRVRKYSRSKTLELHTSTMQPMFQAIVNEEDDKTMTYALEDAIELCKKSGSFDF